MTVLCRDQQGLKALYQVISQMHTNPAHRVQITRSELASYRKHL